MLNYGAKSLIAFLKCLFGKLAFGELADLPPDGCQYG